jgi:hypothetical protein
VAGAGVSVAGATGAIAASTAALAATGIGAVVALVALIATFVGKGCGEACIESSQAEQIYEWASEVLWQVAKAGMLSSSQFTAAIQALLQGGTQHMQSLEASDPKAAAGLKNMTSAISQEGNAALLPSTAPSAINMSQVQSIIAGMSTSGWYPASVSAGNQLALTYLQNLASQAPATASGTATGSGSVAILGQTFSIPEVLGGLAIVAALIYFAS